MRIALVHCYYSSRVPSGENVVVDSQAALLRDAGHDVVVVAQRTDDHLNKHTPRLSAAFTSATGLGPSPAEQLSRFRPDVVHVHNLFPYFGTTWLSGWDGPLVATLHNYRHLCMAGGTLFRDGERCELCPTAGSVLPGVLRGCFHHGRLATVPVAIGTRFDRAPVLVRADLVVTLSGGASEIFARYGVPQEKLRVVENFTDSTAVPGPGGDAWIYAGRFQREKGLHEVLEEWPSDLKLVVAGVEDPKDPLPRRPGVELVGPLEQKSLLQLMGQSRGLLFPSRWLESMAMVCLESLSVGTPVLAFEDVPVGRIVAETGTGLAGSRDDFPGLLRAAHRSFPALREHSRRVFETTYTPTAWLERIVNVYEEAIARRAAT